MGAQELLIRAHVHIFRKFASYVTDNMLLKSVLRPLLSCGLRWYSSGKLIDVSVNGKSGVSTVVMNRTPVNGLNLELLSELSDTLSDLEKNKCRGMILTSVILWGPLIGVLEFGY